MIVIRDQQLRLMVLAHLIRELQAHAQDHGPIPEGFSEKQIEERQCLRDRVYPPDVARMVMFLAADDSRMCTAQNYIVDGGWV